MSGASSYKQQIVLCAARGLFVEPERVKLPARGNAAGAYRPGADCPEPADFPPLLNAPSIACVFRRGDWVYCAFTDAFYNAWVREALNSLPPLNGDAGSLAVNRALRLSQRGGAGCPEDATAQRALLLALCAGDGRGALRRAENALLALHRDKPPRERTLVTDRSGQLFDALGRLLIFHQKSGNQ